MQLSRGDIQQMQHPHNKVVKRQPHEQLREMAHVHIEKLLSSPFFTMAYTINNTNPFQGHNVLSNTPIEYGDAI